MMRRHQLRKYARPAWSPRPLMLYIEVPEAQQLQQELETLSAAVRRAWTVSFPILEGRR